MIKWFKISALAALFLTGSLHARSFNTERWQTGNGARVVFYQAMEVPMLDIKVAFAAGSSYDGQKFGLSALTSQLLNQGSGHLNATDTAERLADVGAQYYAASSRDMLALQLKTLTENEALTQAINTFELIINKPQFKPDTFRQEKNQQLIAIRQSKESPSETANDIFYNKLYQNHPYAHAVNGTTESVNSIQLNDVRQFYHQYFAGNNAVIVMVGAIDSEKAHEIAEQLTHDLPAGSIAPAIPKAASLTAKEQIAVNFPSSQTMLRIGQLGIDHNSPDYFPLMVGNYILGGGSLVSRLSIEVREKRGLTYGVVSQFIPMPADGPFLIGLSTQNNQALKALKVTQDSLASFVAEGPNENEVIAAKQYLMGSFPLSLASNSNIADVLLRIAFYHLPDNYLDTYTSKIAAVSAEDIKKAFASQIQPDKMLIVQVGLLNNKAG